ncbi:amidohydrolase family protein [Bradyrhizobium prioriisuperbiae]|uniref:amidohydrolase family protein n=1 Tax=Bradyrhizobium prioriisuperbiae TaxID=2854389 RepID=UPI0028EF10AF|nr:amidohydrolase family protein [Bradyrhizobium prioritasuperba]
MTRAGRILIRGGTLLSADGVTGRKDVLVVDGLIADVGEPGTLWDESALVHDATARFICPGFVNAHTHGHANLMKGVADAWTLEASLTNGPWLGGKRDPATIYLSTLIGAIDMLSKGCTACFDLVYEFPQPTREGFLAVAAAYHDAGMRAVLAPMVADKSLFQSIPGLTDALPPQLREEVGKMVLAPSDSTMDAIRQIVAARGELPSGVTLAIAPTIPHHCSEQFLLNCCDLAVCHDLPIHMHVAESRLQAVVARRVYGVSAVAYLADLGILSPKFTAAHGVWLDEADLDLLAEHGCSIAHIPASNFRLGSGIAHVRPMLERGINVGLATDGANSSDALSMLQAMRLASYGARAIASAREDWLSAREVLRLATKNGARILGHEAGRIALGLAADLVFLDAEHVDFVPANDPVNQLVTCADSAAVTDVMAGGVFRVRNRKLVSIDLADLGERVSGSLADLTVTMSGVKALASQLEPHVVAFAQHLSREPLGFDRLVRPKAEASS